MFSLVRPFKIDFSFKIKNTFCKLAKKMAAAAALPINWLGTWRDSWNPILTNRDLTHVTPQVCLQRAQAIGAKYVGFSGNNGVDNTTECSYGSQMNLTNDTMLPHVPLDNGEPNLRWIPELGLYLGRQGNWVNTFYEVPVIPVQANSTFTYTKITSAPTTSPQTILAPSSTTTTTVLPLATPPPATISAVTQQIISSTPAAVKAPTKPAPIISTPVTPTPTLTPVLVAPSALPSTSRVVLTQPQLSEDPQTYIPPTSHLGALIAVIVTILVLLLLCGGAFAVSKWDIAGLRSKFPPMLQF
jgi:hypothetical protein